MNNSEYQRYMADNAHRRLKVQAAVSVLVGTSALMKVSSDTKIVDVANAMLDEVGEIVAEDRKAYLQLTEG